MKVENSLKARFMSEVAADLPQKSSSGFSKAERRKMEEEMRIWKNAIESSINAIVIADLDGTITFVNRSFLRMWRYDDADEVIGVPVVKFWKMKGRYVEVLDAVVEKGGWRGELVGERKDRSLFDVQLSASMIENGGGEPRCMMASFIDVTERRQAEDELVRAKEYLQSIINSASEIIVSFDMKNRVSMWNNTVEIVTGYKKREVMGRSIARLTVFDDKREVLDNLESIRLGLKPGFDEFVLRTKNGTKRVIQTSGSVILDNNKQEIGVLLVGKDITKDRETHGKLLRGNSYIISDKNISSTLDLFIGLIRSNYKGLLITRASPEMIKSYFHPLDFQITLLNQETLGGFDNISDLDGLIARITEFSMKNTDSVILLDRIDYLITRYSFEKFINSLYQINSIIAKNGAILLVHVNPSFLDLRQRAILEEELQPLPHQKIESIQIEDELFQILKFIYEQNQKNALVSFNKINKEFSIVKSTTAKRLKKLEDKGLIFIKRQGRSKTPYVSEKGKTLLHKRQII